MDNLGYNLNSTVQNIPRLFNNNSDYINIMSQEQSVDVPDFLPNI